MNNYFKNGANRPAIVLAFVVLAIAALSAWFGYDTGSRGYYWVAGGLAVIAFLIPDFGLINLWKPTGGWQ